MSERETPPGTYASSTSPRAVYGSAEPEWNPADLLQGRRSRMFRTQRSQVAASTISTLLVLGGLAALFLLAPGSDSFRREFFNGHDMWRAFVGDPRYGYYSVGKAILLNIEMFLIAEVLILILALGVALIRQSRSPVLFPLRILSTMYVDFFRGVPLILVIYAIGFGAPALDLHFISYQSAFVYGVVSLVLAYSAYVSEVYRAGLNSVPLSQVASARSLGLRQRTALRYVILPQAIRTIIPPLLNDFISLQKDTALVAVLGLVIEANRAAEIYSSAAFNYSGYTVAALLFLALTIPLARFTDHLIARDRSRRLAGQMP
ncbi:MAG: amino acid ABC transporter permease [Acidimicrobiales bacterium]|jgi:polar amino acid transport system permease protein